jgi:hypothetical protein
MWNCQATDMPGETDTRENAMIKNVLMVSAFALIFAVSASAQEGPRRGDQRFLGSTAAPRPL